MIDHLHNAHSFSLENVDILILDEADSKTFIYLFWSQFLIWLLGMLDMGFEPQIRRIVEQEGMQHSGSNNNHSNTLF